jgi:hypothetical protein
MDRGAFIFAVAQGLLAVPLAALGQQRVKV